jgi:hypothetical protein
MSVWFSPQLVVPLDAHNRKDNDGRGFFRRDFATEAHDTPLVGEFNNGAHLGGPAVVRCLPAADPLIRCDRHRPLPK